MTDLVIRGGMVVDGTGAPAAAGGRRDRERAHQRRRRRERARRPRDRRRRARRVPRLHRRPHALRRPVHLGPVCHEQHLARGDDHGHRQLRLRHRALPARRPRADHADPGEGGGHVVRRDERGHHLAVRDLPRVPRPPRALQPEPERGGAGRPLHDQTVGDGARQPAPHRHLGRGRRHVRARARGDGGGRHRARVVDGGSAHRRGRAAGGEPVGRHVGAPRADARDGRVGPRPVPDHHRIQDVPRRSGGHLARERPAGDLGGVLPARRPAGVRARAAGRHRALRARGRRGAAPGLVPAADDGLHDEEPLPVRGHAGLAAGHERARVALALRVRRSRLPRRTQGRSGRAAVRRVPRPLGPGPGAAGVGRPSTSRSRA